MAFHAYILLCADGSYYTGHTDNFEQRIAQHHAGYLPGYTKSRRPVRLVWSQEFAERHEALGAERQIKGWSRAKKEALIDGRWDEISRLSRCGSNFVLRQAQDERVLIKRPVLDEMFASARDAHPRECCGILLGEGNRITQAIAARNVHPAPQTHFEIDPQALIDAHRAAREGGPQVIGYYHSHPVGKAAPSATDAAMASGDGRVWAILAGAEISFWRDTGNGFQSISYQLKD